MATMMEKETVNRQPGLSAAKQLLFAKWARGQPLHGQSVSAQRIPRRANSTQAPLSFAQQRLWFFNQLDPQSPLYNIVVGVRINGPFQLQALQCALDAIVGRHEILRTRFAAED